MNKILSKWFVVILFFVQNNFCFVIERHDRGRMPVYDIKFLLVVAVAISNRVEYAKSIFFRRIAHLHYPALADPQGQAERG